MQHVGAGTSASQKICNMLDLDSSNSHDTCKLLLVVGCCLLFVGCWLWVAGCWLWVASCGLWVLFVVVALVAIVVAIGIVIVIVVFVVVVIVGLGFRIFGSWDIVSVPFPGLGSSFPLGVFRFPIGFAINLWTNNYTTIALFCAKRAWRRKVLIWFSYPHMWTNDGQRSLFWTTKGLASKVDDMLLFMYHVCTLHSRFVLSSLHMSTTVNDSYSSSKLWALSSGFCFPASATFQPDIASDFSSFQNFHKILKNNCPAWFRSNRSHTFGKSQPWIHIHDFLHIDATFEKLLESKSQRAWTFRLNGIRNWHSGLSLWPAASARHRSKRPEPKLRFGHRFQQCRHASCWTNLFIICKGFPHLHFHQAHHDRQLYQPCSGDDSRWRNWLVLGWTYEFAEHWSALCFLQNLHIPSIHNECNPFHHPRLQSSLWDSEIFIKNCEPDMKFIQPLCQSWAIIDQPAQVIHTFAQPCCIFVVISKLLLDALNILNQALPSAPYENCQRNQSQQKDIHHSKHPNFPWSHIVFWDCSGSHHIVDPSLPVAQGPVQRSNAWKTFVSLCNWFR